jgi:hypothetical protein
MKQVGNLYLVETEDDKIVSIHGVKGGEKVRSSMLLPDPTNITLTEGTI